MKINLKQNDLKKQTSLSKTFESLDPSSYFITKDGVLTKEIKTILSLDGLYNENDSLEELVEKTQKSWIISIQGNNGKERVDVKDKKEDKLAQKKIEQLLKNVGLFDAREPLFNHYNYAGCLGSFLNDVRIQLLMLCKEWEKGIHFDSLIFFSGQRPLRKGENQEESLEKLLNPKLSPIPFKKNWQLPKNTPYETEYDMIKLVWDQCEIPDSMKKALKDKVVFINADKGSNQRPSTRDTYNKWLKDYKPTPGTILVTCYPLVWVYQQLVGMHTLGPNYPLNPICPSVTREELKIRQDYIVSIIHDTVAKCLFEIYSHPTKQRL